MGEINKGVANTLKHGKKYTKKHLGEQLDLPGFRRIVWFGFLMFSWELIGLVWVYFGFFVVFLGLFCAAAGEMCDTIQPVQIMLIFPFPESGVINDFDAKTWAWIGAEKMLRRCWADASSTCCIYPSYRQVLPIPVLFIEYTVTRTDVIFRYPDRVPLTHFVHRAKKVFSMWAWNFCWLFCATGIFRWCNGKVFEHSVGANLRPSDYEPGVLPLRHSSLV